MRLLLFLPLAFLAIACGGAAPAKTPENSPKIRVGKTVVTTCPEKTPSNLDDDPNHIVLVEERTIERVCIFGTTSEEARADVARALAAKEPSLHEGELLNAARARAALDALLAMKSIEDASIAAELRGEGLVVYVDVRERPRIDQVVFHGANAFGDAKLSAKNPLERNAPLDRRVVAAVIQAMKEEYADAGYGAAAIESSVEPSPKSANHVIVRFNINEGPQWKLTKLTFSGSSKVSDADLKKASQLTTGATFNADQVERASLLLSALYYDRGMLMVRVAEPVRDVAADGTVSITWTITEGDVYRVGSIKFGKAGAPHEKALLKDMKLHVGEIFDRSKVVADIAAMRATFEGQGHKVEIVPLTDVDQKTKKVNVTFDITEQ